MAPMPPEELRFNVSGIRDEHLFDEIGRLSVVELDNALASIGRSISGSRRILEWGCGCGRILRHLEFDRDRQEVFGCDTDPNAVKWLAENMLDLNISLNNEFPPLPYENEHFDLIINHSVLTHLDERHQDAWLQELSRVLSPDGTLILTVLGPRAHENWISKLPTGRADLDKAIEDSKAALKNDGIYFFVDDGWADNFPSYYQSTFHAPWYIFNHWSRYFDIACYISHGALAHQDIIVLRHPLPALPARPASGASPLEEIGALKREVAEMRNSTSWRLTQPLRDAVRIYRQSVRRTR